ncbi:hypothetical protein [Candidatus Tokpelaia sp.]|uniref:hypothetical protein n=1 Tax=Candidatus Tokpelaia sp. TaxID=2233777 RepID=UPI00123AE54C|nr:hypothetical protein [Candidatus Tokpelaia sp.]
MPKAENSTNIPRRRLTVLRILCLYLCRYKYPAVIALAALVMTAMIMPAIPVIIVPPEALARKAQDKQAGANAPGAEVDRRYSRCLSL